MKIKNYLSEGIGTFILLYIGCGAIAYFKDPLTISLSFGLVYFVLFYSFGNLSGCHFNPIISTAALIQKKLPVTDFFLYILSQFIGGFLGLLFIRIMLPTNFNPIHSHATQLCCNGDPIAAIFLELIISYLFTLTFIGANSKSRNKNIRGLIICAGVTVIGLIGSIANYSMANPIKAIMSAFFTGSWKHFFVFLIVPFIGCICATYQFIWMHKKEDELNEN